MWLGGILLCVILIYLGIQIFSIVRDVVKKRKDKTNSASSDNLSKTDTPSDKSE